jgi:predicted acetyltransferase
MEKFKLVRPTIEYKEQALEYMNEHYEYKSAIHGVGGLNRYLEDFDGWLEKLERYRNSKITQEIVPAETFFLVRENDNKVIGMIDIRLALNEKLRKSGGHIGYSIRPTERRKGYNKINLYLALLECQKHGLNKVMLTCNKDNLGSAKTIQSFDAELEREFYDDEVYHCIEQVYWIDVDSAIENKKNEFEKYIAN